jgi:uncharacterized protein (DUF488 family)
VEKRTIYTIGHSTHSIDYFLKLLQNCWINCVVDVRSLAASRFNPQYNKKGLMEFLKNKGITYLHFAEEFGARQNDPELLDESGRVDFIKMRKSERFKKGMERLQNGLSKGFSIALMCSESDPLECHRFGMISPALAGAGLDVKHIMKDGAVNSQLQMEQLLLKKYAQKIHLQDIFVGDDAFAQLKVAYKILNREIGFMAEKR